MADCGNNPFSALIGVVLEGTDLKNVELVRRLDEAARTWERERRADRASSLSDESLALPVVPPRVEREGEHPFGGCSPQLKSLVQFPSSPKHQNPRRSTFMKNRSQANARSRKWRRALATALFVSGMAGLTACAAGGAGSELARLKAIHCPALPPATDIAVDVSKTGRSAQLISERFAVIRDALTMTTVCGGRAHVVAFSASATTSRVVFDQELVAQGATDNARLRRVPGIVDGAMQTVEQETRKAMNALPGDGTDVLAQLTLAREYAQQVGDRYTLRVYVLSDGISTTNPVLNTNALTVPVARDLGQRVEVPSFGKGTVVRFAGIGRVAGAKAPPSWFVDALKSFWSTACIRTNAKCQVVTDYTQGS